MPWRSRRSLHLSFFLVFLLIFVLPAQPGQSQEWIYTVRPGDNLWDLSDRHLLSVNYWPRLQSLNDVADPYRLPPGSHLRIPIRWLKTQPIPARIVAATADGRLIRAGGPTEGLQVGSLLFAGDAVETGPGGSVTIQFADGSRQLVAPNSRIQMDKLTAYGDRGMIDSRVRLDKGRTETTVPVDQRPSSRFEIWTPAAVSAVRGTELRVGIVEETARAATEVVTGVAEVRAQERTVRVREGFGVVTEQGRAPSAPKKLLPPPDLSHLTDAFERVPVRFNVKPVPGADRYRVEFAESEAFETLLHHGISEEETLRGPDLPDGFYFVRVRAIDELSLEGLNAVAKVEIDARPEPPLPIKPIKEGKVREPQPEFRWARPVDAASYRLQIAREGDFDERLVADLTLSDTAYTVTDQLTPGLYGWRLATEDSSGEVGPFSDIQAFEYKPAPSSPELKEAEQSDGELTLRWRAGAPGQTFRVQLSEDPQFTKVIVDERLSEPELTVSKLPSGDYYIRIQTIDDDGYAGPFGTPQSISVPPPDYWPAYFLPLLLLLLILI